MDNNITWRMYGLVPYNISEIQKGIQFGHGVVEYAQQHFKDENYQEWAKNHKTFIILNGGTSSTMIQHLSYLNSEDIKNTHFLEPDLNGMMSAVVFLVSSQVFDYENYPDFYTFCLKNKGRNDLPQARSQFEKSQLQALAKEMDSSDYREWVEFMGGEKNIFLREFLSNFRLA